MIELAHQACAESTFCRNPLHPGPCKGWKGLPKVEPTKVRIPAVKKPPAPSRAGHSTVRSAGLKHGDVAVHEGKAVKVNKSGRGYVLTNSKGETVRTHGASAKLDIRKAEQHEADAFNAEHGASKAATVAKVVQAQKAAGPPVVKAAKVAAPKAPAAEPAGDFDSRIKAAKTGRAAMLAAPVITGGNDERPSAPYGQPEPKIGKYDADKIHETLTVYAENGAERWNTEMRKAKGNLAKVSPDAREANEQIDAAMEHSKLTHDVVAWRGIGDPKKAFGRAWSDGKSNAGLAWTEHTPVSTSASKAKAEEFAQGQVMMRILVPKGTPAVTIDDRKQEDELLIGRKRGYRIVNDPGPTPGKVRYIDVEVVK